MTNSFKASIGLTQFIDFTLKGSTAKTNMVKKIKYQNEYHPAFDYWKQLRDYIIKFHSENLDADCFEQLIRSVDKKKNANYTLAIKQYMKFIKNKDVKYFNPGKAIWTNNDTDLVVRANPEIGLFINGEPHIIKLYFKGKTEKVDKRNIQTTLTLLNTSTYEICHNDSVKRSVLNLQKNRLFSSKDINDDLLISLESEAAQFMYIWNKI